MKKKELLNKMIFIIALIAILFSFYKINELNYIKHNQIKSNFVKHPENLPKSDVAKITSFWFKNIRADIYRLEAIQYIWSNVMDAQYKKYLYKMINLITDLNPYFWHPYTVWQLLLPDYNFRYEKMDEKEKEKHINEAEELWLKWVQNFCDIEKINSIKKEYDLNKIWNSNEYINPCKSYEPPFYLAYTYYYYKNLPIESANYYKIAWANKDTPEWSKILAAIMQWKWWDRQKSIYMFLWLAQNSVKKDSKEDELCLTLTNVVWSIYEKYILDAKKIDWNVIKWLEEIRLKVLWTFDEKKEDKFTDWNSCQNYVNKAIREINLYYIEQWNKKFFEKRWINAINAKWLYDEWYLDFLPTDFQQYKDYWIIYVFNKKTNKYDYEMWMYELKKK